MKLFLDFDGPILNNRRKYYALYLELLHDSGAELLTADTYWEKKRARVSEADILESSRVPKERWPGYLQTRLAQIEDFRWLLYDMVWPGVNGWLAAAASCGDLYLVTLRRNRHTLRQQLEYCGLAHYFTQILSTEGNDGSAQVKIDLLRTVLQPGDKGVMVGDTEVDIQAARACGLQAYAVTCGIRNEQLLRQLDPDRLVEYLTDIPIPLPTSRAASEEPHQYSQHIPG